MTAFHDPHTNGHTLAPQAPGALELRLTDDTQAFVSELFGRLGELLQPAHNRWVAEKASYINTFLDVGEGEQTRLSRQSVPWATTYVLVAIDTVLKTAPYAVEEVVDFGYGGRCAPTYRGIEVAPGESREILVDGLYAVRVDEVPLVVQVTEGGEPPVVLLTVFAATVDKETAVALLGAIDAVPNFYRGQVITVDESSVPGFISVPRVELEDVIFDPELWSTIRAQVLDFVGMEAAFRQARLPFRRGVIFAGPPGVGKTLVFRALTHQLAGRCTVLWLTARSIPEPGAVKRVFELARALAPTLMLWEDVDLTVRDRSGGNAAVLGELLAQLDGPGSSDGVIACASTNDPSVLDEALSARPSRFDRVVFVGLPGEAARLRMLQRFMADVPAVKADLAWVAHEAAEMTGADLRELVITAFGEAQRDHSFGDGDGEVAPLRTEHFATALRQLSEATSAARRSGVRRSRGARRAQIGFTGGTA